MEQKKNTDTRKTVRTVTSNDFITALGIEEMTLKARKLLYIAISQCKKNDQEFFEYQINYFLIYLTILVLFHLLFPMLL